MSLRQRLQKQNENIAKKVEKENVIYNDPFSELKDNIKSKVIEEITIDYKEVNEKNESLKLEIEDLIIELIDNENLNITRIERSKIIDDVLDEILGFGPITPLLRDIDVSEIMVNGPNMVYAEKKGKLVLTDIKFKDNNHVLHVIEKIVAPIGRRIDESSPMVDARLPNGSRVNAIIPPLALDGPTITIRKFSEDPFTVADLIGFGTLTTEMAELIRIGIEGRLNVVVSGGTGSGKTTTLNVLSSFIPNDERIVTIEDAAELRLTQDHVVRLETRPANIEGKGEISIRDLVKNSLRMRPDRIVVGEVRSGEALDMLQAMNTGHDGSLTTGHANSPRDMISRLETMVLMSGMELPIKAIREQIGSAVDLIVQQSRLKDGSRKITHITEIQGLEGDVIVLQDVFKFVQEGLDDKGKIIGSYKFTGIKPKFVEKLEEKNIKIPSNIFA